METVNSRLKEFIKDYRLPEYNEIPNVGLYLEQVVKYINTYLEPFGDHLITKTMVSNYVKKGLVSNPIKKMYYRDQIGLLLYIAICKISLPLENIQTLYNYGNQKYETAHMYKVFCEEFENMLYYLFTYKDALSVISKDEPEERQLLRSSVTTVAHQLYIEQYFKMLEKK